MTLPKLMTVYVFKHSASQNAAIFAEKKKNEELLWFKSSTHFYQQKKLSNLNFMSTIRLIKSLS